MAIDQLNENLSLFRKNYSEKENLYAELMNHFQWSFQLTGTEILKNYDPLKPLIVIANHPHGLQDGVMLGQLLQMHLQKEAVFLSNEIVAKIFPELKPHSISIHNMGLDKNAKSKNFLALRKAIRSLKTNTPLVVFPAGQVSYLRQKNYRISITDGNWAETVAQLARITDAQILALHIEGHNSNAFLAMRLLGTNAGRLMLFRELLKSQNSHYQIHLKALISPEINPPKDDLQFTDTIRTLVYGE